MVGVPAAADVLFLIFFLENQSDLRMPFNLGEEAVDIDVAKASGEGDLLVRTNVLVPHDNYAVISERLANVGELVGVSHVSIQDFSASAAGERFDFHCTAPFVSFWCQTVRRSVRPAANTFCEGPSGSAPI